MDVLDEMREPELLRHMRVDFDLADFELYSQFSILTWMSERSLTDRDIVRMQEVAAKYERVLRCVLEVFPS